MMFLRSISRCLSPFVLLLSVTQPALHAQTAAAAPTRVERFISHFDLGAGGTALFTKDVSGTIANTVTTAPYNVTQGASTAGGLLVQVRAQKSPLVGLEFNYGYAKVAQTYSCCNYNATTGALVGPFRSQATAQEFTFGYLVRPDHPIFGLQPYAAAGAGTIEFKPTRTGGQGLSPQARMAYYYAVGGEAPVLGSLGVRFGLRQLFYLAPDFGQNYLTIKKHTFTVEPQLGVYYHF